MKRITPFLIATFGILILFNSCSDKNYDSNIQQLVKKEVTPSMPGDANYSDDNRAIIKTASIALEVNQLEKAIMELKTALRPINGYVYNYEINNASYAQDSYQKNMDSTVTIEKVLPHSSLSVRIPIAHADSFINYILSADAQIASLKISDEDVTENLWEKNEVAKVYGQSGKAQQQKGSSKNISYDNNTSIDAIKAKATAAKMNYRTQYLWFDITMNAKPLIKTKTTIAIKNYRTSIHIGLANSIINGWHICEDILLGLITIWPVLILIGLVYFIVRKFRVRTSI